jgi:hypothetical protein
VDYLGERGIRFVVLHIASGPRRIEEQLATFLTAYAERRGVVYLNPSLAREDFLPVDGHLSSQGARRVAESLVEVLGAGVR